MNKCEETMEHDFDSNKDNEKCKKCGMTFLEVKREFYESLFLN